MAFGKCAKQPSSGVLENSAGMACTELKHNILDDLATNFRALCKVAGCRICSMRGITGKQPAYCLDHGPLKDSLVLTLQTIRTKCSLRSPSHMLPYRRGSSFRVKAWCCFQSVCCVNKHSALTVPTLREAFCDEGD